MSRRARDRPKDKSMVALPAVLILALVLGVPIAVALAASGMLGIYLVTGDLGKLMGILSLTPFSTVADYALTTIPMFILMAFFSAPAGSHATSTPPPPIGARTSRAGSPSPPSLPVAYSAPCRARARPPPR